MAAMSEPRPIRGVAMGAPAVETSIGVLLEDRGGGVTAVVEGTTVVPGADPETEAV
jgi:hypothetical protein